VTLGGRALAASPARGKIEADVSHLSGPVREVVRVVRQFGTCYPRRRPVGRCGGLFVKRLIDVTVSLAALAVLWPVLVVFAVLIRVKLGAPVLYRQTRPGLDGRPFEMVKFRSMTDARGPDGALLIDHERLPPFGAFLRAASIDELPELWNVLRGDMSLVGPRPLLMDYLPLYSPEQARRHAVRPGITGWAQVKGRNALSWDAKFALDVWYVENRSTWLDLKILALTVVAVFRREGIDAGPATTMPRFTGNR